METKECSKCKEIKNIEEFFKDIHKSDGFRSSCKTCSMKTTYNWRNKNKKRQTEYNKEYRSLNFKKLREKDNLNCMTLERKFQRWHMGAKRRSIEWKLKFEDIKDFPLICHYTNLPLTLELNKENTISLDRIDNTKGYIKDNVVFCCSEVNLMKKTLSVDKFVYFCELVCSNKSVKICKI